MTFTRFVEVGRVAYCVYGPDAGKLVVIVDVIDQNRALVDGPQTGVTRKSMNFKHMHLTKFVMTIPRSARTGIVSKIWDKEEISKKWEESAWAKKLANKEKRAQMCDFDRFKLMKAQQARNRLINVQFGKLRKELKANPSQAKKRVNKKPNNK